MFVMGIGPYTVGLPRDQTAPVDAGPWASPGSGRRVNLPAVAIFVNFRFENVGLFW